MRKEDSALVPAGEEHRAAAQGAEQKQSQSKSTSWGWKRDKRSSKGSHIAVEKEGKRIKTTTPTAAAARQCGGCW